jgi:hypothetical protein
LLLRWYIQLDKFTAIYWHNISIDVSICIC